MYLSLNGIPKKIPSKSSEIYFIRNGQGAWYPNHHNYLNEVEYACLQLDDEFTKRLFGSLDSAFLMYAPAFLSTAGMNSESTISKELFINLLDSLPRNLPITKALYLFDCQKLVSGVHGCSMEVMQLQGEFYRTLNLEELSDFDEEDGIRYTASPIATKLHALLGFIYIRLHSILDYVTKLAIEIDNLKTKFDVYPRLASKNLLYGDRKKVSCNEHERTLFEQCPLLTEIETVRNHLIHEGLLDDMPKVYRVISDGECVEKFLLFPDQTKEGRFDTFKNRNLFYGNENKINYHLPHLIEQFQNRLVQTLNLFIDRLNKKRD